MLSAQSRYYEQKQDMFKRMVCIRDHPLFSLENIYETK